MLKKIEIAAHEDYIPVIKAAADVIVQVMDAGARQRESANRDVNEWLGRPSEERLHRAFMHLVSCKTHEGVNGYPWSLTSDTMLEDYKHALTGLAMCAAKEGCYLDSEIVGLVVDSTEEQVKGE